LGRPDGGETAKTESEDDMPEMFAVLLIAGVIFGWPLILGFGSLTLLLRATARWLERRHPHHQATSRLVGVARHPAILVGVIANVLVVLLWCMFAVGVQPGAAVRPMNTSTAAVATCGAALLVGVPLALWSYRRTRAWLPVMIAIALNVVPWPISQAIASRIERDLNLVFKP
jgi:hypothetical protein